MAMKIIGITGPTGAGKTTALRALAQLGVWIIDADEVYHRLLEESVPLQMALTARFGELQDERGKIDRKKLGNVVFGDPEALAALNAITHRFIGEEIDRQLSAARAEDRSAAAIDAIALIESGLGALCDCTVAVTAPPEVRIRRIMARDGISEDYARSRVAAQKSDSFYRKRCTLVLENRAGSRAEFDRLVEDFFKGLLCEDVEE